MRIDETGEGSGHDDACLAEPFPERCGSDEDAGKGQGKSQSSREAEGSAALRLALGLLLERPYRKERSINNGSQAGADQRHRKGLKGCHASGGENKGHLDDRRNR